MSQVEVTFASNNTDAITISSEKFGIQIKETPNGIEFLSDESETTKYLNDFISQFIGKKVNITIKHDNGPRRRASGWVVSIPNLHLPFISYKPIEKTVTGDLPTDRLPEATAPEYLGSSTGLSEPEQSPIGTATEPESPIAPVDSAATTADDAGDGTTPPFGGGGSEGSW